MELGARGLCPRTPYSEPAKHHRDILQLGNTLMNKSKIFIFSQIGSRTSAPKIKVISKRITKWTQNIF